jgi:hypothetical protein
VKYDKLEKHLKKTCVCYQAIEYRLYFWSGPGIDIWVELDSNENVTIYKKMDGVEMDVLDKYIDGCNNE